MIGQCNVLRRISHKLLRLTCVCVRRDQVGSFSLALLVVLHCPQYVFNYPLYMCTCCTNYNTHCRPYMYLKFLHSNVLSITLDGHSTCVLHCMPIVLHYPCCILWFSWAYFYHIFKTKFLPPPPPSPGRVSVLAALKTAGTQYTFHGQSSFPLRPSFLHSFAHGFWSY